jgi:hypothetical protein
MEGMNSTMIYCKYLDKCHTVSPVQQQEKKKDKKKRKKKIIKEIWKKKEESHFSMVYV